MVRPLSRGQHSAHSVMGRPRVGTLEANRPGVVTSASVWPGGWSWPMSKYGYSGYTLLVTVFLPLLILIWASCLVICLYKHIVARLERTRTGQCPSVRVVVENNNIISPPQQQHKQQQQQQAGQTVISSQYAPVTSHLASSLTMADFLKMKKDINLEDSLGPKYYPTAPISTIPEPPAAEVQFSNQTKIFNIFYSNIFRTCSPRRWRRWCRRGRTSPPSAPPPMRNQSPPRLAQGPTYILLFTSFTSPIELSRSLNASFNNRVNFLSNQILNPQNHTQQAGARNDRRIIR